GAGTRVGGSCLIFAIAEQNGRFSQRKFGLLKGWQDGRLVRLPHPAREQKGPRQHVQILIDFHVAGMDEAIVAQHQRLKRVFNIVYERCAANLPDILLWAAQNQSGWDSFGSNLGYFLCRWPDDPFHAAARVKSRQLPTITSQSFHLYPARLTFR